MTSANESPDDNELLPDTFVRRLKEVEQIPFEVSSEKHAEILGQSKRELTPQLIVRPQRRWTRVVAAVSSVCAALVLIAIVQRGDHESAEGLPVADLISKVAESPVVAVSELDPKDIDENGRVDILDAYAMARLLESGDHGGTWDFNSDGQTDEDDVRLVALDAVML